MVDDAIVNAILIAIVSICVDHAIVNATSIDILNSMSVVIVDSISIDDMISGAIVIVIVILILIVIVIVILLVIVLVIAIFGSISNEMNVDHPSIDRAGDERNDRRSVD